MPSRFRLRGPSEHQIQASLFDWAKLACRAYPELRLLYAIPNGFHAAGRSPGERARHVARMKSEGMKSGVPDVCLPVPRGGFGALYLEHKSDQGSVSDAQVQWIEELSAAGNKCVVSRSFAESRDTIVSYLGLGIGLLFG